MSGVASARTAGLAAGAALITGTGLGTLGSTVMPDLLPGMADRFHLSSTGTGMIATVQLIMTALVTFALTSRAARPGRARIARMGLIATAAGFALAMAAPGFTMLTAGNILAGAGLGAVNAAATAAIAATDDADRASSIAVVGATIVAAVFVIALPQAQAAWGTSAQFAVLAACCIPAIWLVRALPDAREDRSSAASVPIPVPFLLAVALFGASDQGAWSYSATLGEKYGGMSTGEVSTVLAVASIASLAGVIVSQVAIPRIGRLTVITALIVADGLAKLVIAVVPWWGAFAAAAVLWQVCYMGLLVSVLAVAASVDGTGRWVTAAGGALAIGTALGPAPSGWVLGTWGSAAFGLVLAASTALAAIPLLRVTRVIKACGVPEPE